MNEPSGNSDAPIVILNDRAGSVVGSSIQDVTQRVEDGFRAAGRESPRIVSCSPDKLEKTLHVALGKSPARIIVGGGDGTVATAARVLMGQATALGILPMGTYNLVARDLGIPLDLELAAESLATAEPTAIDVAEVNGIPYLCVCVLGFFPNVALKKDAYRGLSWWRKSLEIARTMLSSFSRYPYLKLRMKSGSESMEKFPDIPIRTRFVAIANNPYTDAPGLIPSRASLTSGDLAVYTSNHHSVPDIIDASLAFIAGSMRDDPLLSVRSLSSLEIDAHRRRTLRVMLDGEILTLRNPLKFTMHPGSLAVLKPTVSI